MDSALGIVAMLVTLAILLIGVATIIVIGFVRVRSVRDNVNHSREWTTSKALGSCGLDIFN